MGAFLAQPKSALLAQLVTALADLAAPKKTLPLLQDPARISFYEAALSALISELPGVPLLLALTLIRGTEMQQASRSWARAGHTSSPIEGGEVSMPLCSLKKFLCSFFGPSCDLSPSQQ